MSSSSGRGRGTSGTRGRSSRRSSATRGAAATPLASSTSSRSSRRQSTDPYPKPAVTSSSDRGEGEDEEELPSQAGPSRAPTSSAPAPPNPPPQEHQSAERPLPTADSSRAAPTPPDKTYDLIVIQQPSVGAAVGMDRMTLGRLPIVPAPVVQLIVRNQDGEESDVELPYLFCSCVLRQEDGVSPVEISAPEGSNTREAASFSALLGSLVRNAHSVTDLEGNAVSQFVFEDISVRLQGRYTLEFRLGEATSSRPQSPRLAAVVSDPFDVVPWEEYPGRPAADILTDVSKHLHEQGVPMYIPPLVLSTAAPPPPPSSNPFPDDDIPNLPLSSQSNSSPTVPPEDTPSS